MNVLLIQKDSALAVRHASVLRRAHHDVAIASSGMQSLALLEQHTFDLIVSDLFLPDMSALELMRLLRARAFVTPFVVVTGAAATSNVVAAMFGASGALEKPLADSDVLRAVSQLLTGWPADAEVAGDPANDHGDDPEAHAASRVARALAPILHCARDPRTIADWGRAIFVSPGALRNWCRTAGISPRTLLVFGRLLRAVYLSRDGRHKPETLLDVVDRRTLVGLVKFAGLGTEREFPTDVDTFLRRQMLIRDPDTLNEIRRVLLQQVAPAELSKLSA
jgi:CheY-like chemotaxis protein